MLSVQYISQKLGLAKHILAVTSEFVDDIYDLNYFDLDITHTSDTATNTIHRTNAISHCTSQEEERQLTDRQLTDNMPGTPKCVGIPPPVTTTVSEQQYIPSWLHRRIAHTLGAVTVWHRPHMWLTGQHHCLTRPELSCPGAAAHGIGNWMDIQPAFPFSLPSCVKHLWLWAPAYEVPVVQSTFPSLSSVGWSKGSTVWHLLGSQEAQRSVDETQILRIHLILQEAGHSSLSIPRIPETPLVLRALTIQMQTALYNKNLGRWAELMQARNRYLPFLSHPALAMARRLSHVHRWFISLTPPRNVVYLVYNIWLQVVYIGLTTGALISRLRKHMTDSLADVDCATLHKHMAKTDLSSWGILPPQWVEDWHASVRERHWWWIFRRWACNDVPPGISTQGAGSKSRGWLNQRVLAALQGIRDARRTSDWPRVKFLLSELQDLANRLSIPLYVLGHVTVPNLTPIQNSAIHRVIRAMVKSCNIAAWEKQALHKAVRVVRSNPVTVRSLFEKQSRKGDREAQKPQCTCASITSDHGHVIEIEGHKALIPVHVESLDATTLRPNDPLPLKGTKVRARLFKDITKIAGQIGAEVPNLEHMLPSTLWCESGSTVRHVEQQATAICASHYVRIVDKGVGVMWGFCRQWMWDILEEFLIQEGYTRCNQSQQDITAQIRKIIQSNGWDNDQAGRIASLYLIGKAKSLIKQKWLWRPIAALPKPLLPKKDLTIAARAMTTFLKLVAEETPGNFMVHSVNRVADWFHWLPSVGRSYIVELDCKDQFNHVPPSCVESHMTESSKWLAKRRRWRMKDICLSVHRDSKKLDRASLRKILVHHARGPQRQDKFRAAKQQLRDSGRVPVAKDGVYSHGGVILRAGSGSALPVGGVYEQSALQRPWGTPHHKNRFHILGYPLGSTHTVPISRQHSHGHGLCRHPSHQNS